MQIKVDQRVLTKKTRPISYAGIIRIRFLGMISAVWFSQSTPFAFKGI